MLKTLFNKIIFAFIVITLGNVYASSFEVVIDRGTKTTTPIAVSPFVFEGKVKPLFDIHAIISNDLNNSGYFSTVNVNSFPQNPNDIISPSLWSNKNINIIVRGKVIEKDKKYYINYELLDLLGVKRSPGSQIISGNIEVNSKGIRLASHTISNQVFKAYTGIDGDFTTKIAFVIQPVLGVKNYELYVADYDGFNKTLAFKSNNPIISPAFSADNSELAYVTYSNHQSMINTYNLNTGKIKKLLSVNNGYTGSPAYSKDGKYFSYTQSKGNVFDIYVMNLETGKIDNITNGKGNNTESSWFNDKIIFTSDRLGVAKIFQSNISGSYQTVISNSNLQSTNARISGVNNSLYYINNDRLVEQNLYSNNIRYITNTFLDENPSISPNGLMVLYTSVIGNKKNLSMLSINTDKVVELLISDGQVSYSTWSN